ncbi:hypothetical protein MJH12_00625 [bacterium]|nr:hypothetical protein [bacterium]
MNYKGSQSRVSFPPPMDFYDQQMWIFDVISKKLISVKDPTKKIDLESVNQKFPIDDFKIMSYGKIFLLSKQRTSLALFDSYRKRLQLISKKSQKNDMFFEMTSMKKLSNQIFISDSVSGYIRIFSNSGYFLGSLKAYTEDFLPFSALEVITLQSEGQIASLGWSSMTGGQKVFYSQEKTKEDEFISLKFAGIDSNKNVYVQKVYGPTHGLAKLAIQKISPRGDLIFEKETEMSLFEYQEFERFFFVNKDGSISQFKHISSKDSLVLRPIK